MSSHDALTVGARPQSGDSGTQSRDTIVMVRWTLIIACAYLMLFSDGSAGIHGLSLAVIALFLGSNLVVGRLPPEVVQTQQFRIGVAALDTVLIAASLYLSGQLVVELVVLLLGVLVLAVAGLRPGMIAAVTLGMTGVYLLLVSVGGGQSLLRSSMLLRVPFLLCAAIVYAWMTDAGRAQRAPDTQQPGMSLTTLAADLGAQLDAIRRCQTAVTARQESEVRIALEEVASKNQAMQAKLIGLKPSPGLQANVAAATRNAA